MRKLKFANFTRRQLQYVARHERQFETRQEIVANRAWRRLGFGHSDQILPTTAALPFKLIDKGRPERQRPLAKMVFQIELLRSMDL
jgi:hypothetical protein